MESRQECSGNARGALPEAAREFLSRYSKIAVAFSGGLDSRFLCHAARLMDLDVFAIHVSGPHFSRRESDQARNWAAANKIAFREIRFDPLTLPEASANGRLRCYECKKNMLKLALAEAREFGAVLCDGGNADDLKVYRPGLRAAREAGVLSPLAAAGLTKSDIRDAARETGMDRPDQKARPCLLTRYAYGLAPDAETLRKLAETEAELESALGDADFRLRLMPEPVLQIERDPGESRGAILKILADGGFGSARIDIAERIGGYYDRESSG